MKAIKADELKKLMLQGNVVTVINVLPKDYYGDCHIEGSIHISGDDLEAKTKDWDKSKQIVVHCASYECSASKQAAQLLEKLGFTNVQAYEGGMKEWLQKGLPCEGPCKKDYLKQ